LGNLRAAPNENLKKNFSENALAERPTQAIDTSCIQGPQGGKDTCPRCGGSVFHAEKMMSKNNVSAEFFFHLRGMLSMQKR
jgi:hypothetical protein